MLDAHAWRDGSAIPVAFGGKHTFWTAGDLQVTATCLDKPPNQIRPLCFRGDFLHIASDAGCNSPDSGCRAPLSSPPAPGA